MAFQSSVEGCVLGGGALTVNKSWKLTLLPEMKQQR